MRGLYGPDYQVRLGEHVARVRLDAPRSIDFDDLGSRVERIGMMNLVSITFVADARIEHGRARVVSSGQTFRWRGDDDGERAGVRRMRVAEWHDPNGPVLELAP